MNTRSVLIGAYEIKYAYQRNMAIGFAIAAMVQISLAISLLLFIPVNSSIPIIIDRMPPKPINFYIPPVVGVKPPAQKDTGNKTKTVPKIIIPKPVADSLAPSENTFISQRDLIKMAPDTPIDVFNGNTVINSGLVIDSMLPPRGTFIPFNDPPLTVNSVMPEYPDLARRTGLEGIVWLDVLIDKDGTVRDVSVVKCNNKDLGFEDAAMAAAWKSVWKPAISNGLPIAVRVTYKVVFKLK
jgi:TonB family protein